MKVQGEMGKLQNRVSDHMLLFVENKSYSSYLILSWVCLWFFKKGNVMLFMTNDTIKLKEINSFSFTVY